jgi:Zn ribbon nucleic-acid-binding protein
LKSHTLEQIEGCALLPADFYSLLDAVSWWIEDDGIWLECVECVDHVDIGGKRREL